MKNQLSTEDIRQMMLQLSDHMISAETMLTNLDSAIGDGDLGMTMVIGFTEIKQRILGESFGSISELLALLRRCLFPKSSIYICHPFDLHDEGSWKRGRGPDLCRHSKSRTVV